MSRILLISSFAAPACSVWYPERHCRSDRQSKQLGVEDAQACADVGIDPGSSLFNQLRSAICTIPCGP